MGRTIYVDCAFCQGMMEVDAETGAVVRKWSPQERAAGGDDKMASALKKLEDAKKKRAGLFDRAKDEIEDQRRKAQDAFQKEVERTKKEGIKENPLRPFDLD